MTDKHHKGIEMVAGFFQGIASIMSSYPLEYFLSSTIKTRMQKSYYSSTSECIRNLFKTEGLRGFYRGASSLVTTVPFRSSFNITLYSHLKHTKNYQNHFLRGFIPGCITGGVLSIFVCPVEMIKCKMQVSNEFSSSFECLKSLYSSKGLNYLFRGIQVTLARDILGVGIFFGVYELIKGTIQDSSYKFTWWGWILCGSVSGAVCWLSILPLDCIKTRYQLAAGNLSYKLVISDIFQNHGIKGFWVGSLSTIIRTFIASGVGFSVYELMKHHLPKVFLV